MFFVTVLEDRYGFFEFADVAVLRGGAYDSLDLDFIRIAQGRSGELVVHVLIAKIDAFERVCRVVRVERDGIGVVIGGEGKPERLLRGLEFAAAGKGMAHAETGGAEFRALRIEHRRDLPGGVDKAVHIEEGVRDAEADIHAFALVAAVCERAAIEPERADIVARVGLFVRLPDEEAVMCGDVYNTSGLPAQTLFPFAIREIFDFVPVVTHFPLVRAPRRAPSLLRAAPSAPIYRNYSVCRKNCIRALRSRRSR